MMLPVLWGIVAAVLIGVSDCIARVTTRRISSDWLVLVIMLTSSTVLTLWLGAQALWPPWHIGAWAASCLSGMLNVVALQCLYAAIRRGPVSVASPTAASFSVLLVLFNALAGEPWSVWQLASVLIVFTGVAMLSQRSDPAGVDKDYDAPWLRRTALLALAAALAIALRMFLAQEAGAEIGALSALYLNRLFALVFISLWLLWRLQHHAGLPSVSHSLAWLIGVQALLETLALGAFLVGSGGPGRVPATIGFSMFAAVTVITARVWLGERIGFRRLLWIVVVVAGVMLSSVG